MPKDFYPDIARILKQAGWVRTTTGKGSHEKWLNKATGDTVVVPRTKSRHTANEVMKQAKLPKAF